jgi:hypothetical protein
MRSVKNVTKGYSHAQVKVRDGLSPLPEFLFLGLVSDANRSFFL